MPLPPALLARLRKRGIVEADAQEEVIAEWYDDEKTSTKPGGGGGEQQTQPMANSAGYAIGCPNKNNPFHQCVEYCHIHWGDGVVPESGPRDQTYERRRRRMLRRYPLPSSDWREIYDAGFGRYYYWNTSTDEVCWLSPTHPRAKIGMAAPKLAKIEWEKLLRVRADEERKRSERRAPPVEREGGRFSRRRKRSVSPPESDGDDQSEDDAAPADDGGGGGVGRRTKPKTMGKRKRNDLDPMDPASYSDIAPGSWSSGLETKGDAKTGVDTTANGPLFQQRPYPAPGAILKQNKQTKKPAAAGGKKGPAIGPVNPYGAN